MVNVRYMTAKEAAALLGVKEATLYAYVSRGLIRSEAISDAPRQRLYLAEDVQKLAERKVQRRDPAKAARDALQDDFDGARVLQQMAYAAHAGQPEREAQRFVRRVVQGPFGHEPCQLLIHAQPFARFCRISNAGRVLPSSTSRKAPPPVEM